MIPQFQDIKEGECIRACIASIIEVDQNTLMKLSTFAASEGVSDLDDIWTNWVHFAAMAAGYTAHIELNSRKAPAMIPKGDPKGDYYIAIGITSLMTEHAAVYKDGELAHDPWPGGEGLIKITKVITLVPRLLKA